MKQTNLTEEAKLLALGRQFFNNFISTLLQWYLNNKHSYYIGQVKRRQKKPFSPTACCISVIKEPYLTIQSPVWAPVAWRQKQNRNLLSISVRTNVKWSTVMLKTEKIYTNILAYICLIQIYSYCKAINIWRRFKLVDLAGT